jgi:NAD(P)-dependent dehydrogenase (short-subunit alcohol dehydrogenase family)
VTADDPFRLDGRVVAVTGAGRGIGRAIAIAVHRAGGTVVAGSRTRPELDALQEEIEADGGSCTTALLDVTSLESIDQFVAEAVERHGRIDGLVNNAGDNIGKPAVDYDEAQFDHLVNTNFKGTYFMATRVAGVMSAADPAGGSIVNITSQAGCVGAPRRAPNSGGQAAG